MHGSADSYGLHLVHAETPLFVLVVCGDKLSSSGPTRFCISTRPGRPAGPETNRDSRCTPNLPISPIRVLYMCLWQQSHMLMEFRV